MTRVMDGVRPTPGALRAVELPRLAPAPKPATVMPAPGPRRFVVGMDGIRRSVPAAAQTPVTPREVVAAMQAPVAAPAQAEAPVRPGLPTLPPSQAPAPAAMSREALAAQGGTLAAQGGTLAETPVWQMPSLRLPQVQWRRPAIAFGLVATAFIASGLAVRATSTPTNTTARAAVEQPVATPVATPAPAVAAPVPQKAGLQQILNEFAAANPGKFSIVVKNLASGETGVVEPDRQLTSASLYKLFVAQRIYQQIDLGQLTYGRSAGGGTGRNVQDCLRVMINVSDNACGRALGTLLGWSAQDQALSIEGYHQTTLATPQKTSAADVATMLTRLYHGTLVSASSGEKFMGLLKDQRVNNRLPKGLPAGTVIAHKTGDLDGYVHDAGIVYGPKSNYLVVVTSGAWTAPANAAPQFAALSAKLWNYFEN